LLWETILFLSLNCDNTGSTSIEYEIGIIERERAATSTSNSREGERKHNKLQIAPERERGSTTSSTLPCAKSLSAISNQP
jgi:hypothetical protein